MRAASIVSPAACRWPPKRVISGATDSPRPTSSARELTPCSAVVMRPARSDNCDSSAAIVAFAESSLALAALIESCAFAKDAAAAFKRDLNVLVSRGVLRMYQVAQAEYRRTLDAQGRLYVSDYASGRIRVVTQVPASEPTVPSLTAVYPGTDFPEREAFGLLGITFEGHPDLARILMPDDWIGHPLRKDTPAARVPVTFKGSPSPR